MYRTVQLTESEYRTLLNALSPTERMAFQNRQRSHSYKMQQEKKAAEREKQKTKNDMRKQYRNGLADGLFLGSRNR